MFPPLCLLAFGESSARRPVTLVPSDLPSSYPCHFSLPLTPLPQRSVFSPERILLTVPRHLPPPLRPAAAAAASRTWTQKTAAPTSAAGRWPSRPGEFSPWRSFDESQPSGPSVERIQVIDALLTRRARSCRQSSRATRATGTMKEDDDDDDEEDNEVHLMVSLWLARSGVLN